MRMNFAANVLLNASRQWYIMASIYVLEVQVK